MGSILEKLYWGEIRPCEQYADADRSIAKILSQLVQLEEEVLATLPDDAAERFRAYQECAGRLQSAAEADRFCTGFAMGVRMMVEVIGSKEES